MANDNNNELQLPSASVDLTAVAPATLARLPRDIAKEFMAVFFRESDMELALGIVHPELIKVGAENALSSLEKEVGKQIKLFKISEDDFKQVFALYDRNISAVSSNTEQVRESDDLGAQPDSNQPPTYKVGSQVNDNLLSKVPFNYGKQYRLIAVDQSQDGTVWLVTDRKDKLIDALISLLAKRNRLDVKKKIVPRQEINRLLDLARAFEDRKRAEIEAKKREEREQVELQAKQQEESRLGPLPMPSEAKEGDDGQIISGQIEKAGLAGLLQQAAGLFSGSASKKSKDEPKVTDTVKEDERQAKSKNESGQEKEKPLTMPKSTESHHKDDGGVPVIKDVPIPSAPENTPVDRHEVDVLFQQPVTNINQLQSIIKSGSVPRMVAGIINFAVAERASDIHLEPYIDELLIRYRVDGQLSEIIKLPMTVHPAMVSRIKIISKLKLDESRIPQDGRFEVMAAGKKEIDVRVSTLPTVHGEKVVMRLLDKSEGIYTLEKLGLTGHGFNVLVESIKRAYGVVLSTGPTGSGKTTTLYAILQRVATTNVNVVTLEDPVEYEMPGINQSQIKPKIGFTFADGLRSVLRQDPNIIMVGEVRDAETASMVTHSALTGHLVLSTLHTNDASGALPRLINMGVEPFLITSAINAIVGQRLVRRLCTKCREKVDLPATVRKEIDQDLEDIRHVNKEDAARIPPKIEFYRPRGCDECADGYKGRIGLFEVLTMSDHIEELAINKAPAMEIRQTASREGMITMKQDGILKVLAGITSLDEVLRETSSR